ncbi:hypothetical protein PR048_031740 [Dryococelus australis]|uniref:Uncharacterized protein n=1 Tax=Dryococelus australis TaxID=614101 RepID=A0ABQ9GA65_9NEOP|nr:hypothetical protein PR048_031740 [Dryococelus australis]
MDIALDINQIDGGSAGSTAAVCGFDAEDCGLESLTLTTAAGGDDKDKLLHRVGTGYTWSRVEAILQENYETKWTLDFYAGKLFNTREAQQESIASWASRIIKLGNNLHDSALGDCTAGLTDKCIQTVVPSSGNIGFTEAVEVALEQEWNIVSKGEMQYGIYSTARCNEVHNMWKDGPHSQKLLFMQ